MRPTLLILFLISACSALRVLASAPTASGLDVMAVEPTGEPSSARTCRATSLDASTATEEVAPLRERVSVTTLRSDAAPVSRPIAAGSGATARMGGRVTIGGRGRAATLEFVGGPNKGLVLTTEADGTFSASELCPGLGVYSVRVGGQVLCREIRLRHRADTRLDLDFGAYGQVLGSVRDEQGNAIAQAQVTLDGRELSSGLDGGFRVEGAASGPRMLLVRAPGYVPYREILADGDVECSIELHPEARLSLSVGGDGPGDVDVYLFPTGGQRLAGRTPEPTYPWHELNPIRVAAGSRLELQGLPSTRVDVQAFAVGSRSEPVTVWLTPGKPASVHLDLVPVARASGRITDQGQPLSNVSFVLRPTNPVRATQIALGSFGPLYLSQTIELLPSTRQEVTTDADGRFEYARWEKDSGPYRLTLTSDADGRTLEPSDAGGELVLDLDRQ